MMLLIPYFFVLITAQSGCEPKYTNFYPKKQQIANLNISDTISGFNYSLINPPNGINLIQSGQLLFGETFEEDIQKVLFADLEVIYEYPIVEQIASLIQINNTSYQVWVMITYYNQTYQSQLYGVFNSDYQCLSIRQMNSDFMIINCLQNQIVTIYQGNVQTSILPNITSNNYPSQIQTFTIFGDQYLFVIFPVNLNESFTFNLSVSSSNIVEYALVSQFTFSGTVYNIMISSGYQFLLTSEYLYALAVNEPNLDHTGLPINDCYYFNLIELRIFPQIKIMILCQNNIQQYNFQLDGDQIFVFIQNITYPFTSNFSVTQNYIPLQLNEEYMILQQDQNYIIYDLVKNKINFNSINNQPLFVLINLYSSTYFTLSTTDVKILYLQNPLLVINQLEYQLSNISIQISYNIALNISCQISLNIIPSTNNGIYQKNSSKQLPQKTTQTIPIKIDMNDYFIGSNISFSMQNSSNILYFYSLDLYLVSKTTSNSYYNQIMDSEIIFIQNEFLEESIYFVLLQYKNFTFQTYYCDISQVNYEQYNQFLTCAPYYYFWWQFSEQVQTMTMTNRTFVCLGFITNVQCTQTSFGGVISDFAVQSQILQLQSINTNQQLLFVMQEDIINVFNIQDFQNGYLYNISNITPTQIIANHELYGNLLFVNNQTQLLIYYCTPSQAYLNQSINISILNPTIILAQEYLYISNSTMKKTYYIYNQYQIQFIGVECGNYIGQYYFNTNLKFYVSFSPDYMLSIFQNSGQDNQLFKSIQLDSSIESVSLTNVDKLIVLNFLQNEQIVTYLIDQYQTLMIFPAILNYDQLTVYYTINASNENGSQILSNETLLVLNSGVIIYAYQYENPQIYLTHDNKSFSLDTSFMKGQVTDYSLNCAICEKYYVTQQYQLLNSSFSLNTMTYIQNQNLIAYQESNKIYLYNLTTNVSTIFVAFPYQNQLEWYWTVYISNLNIIVASCQADYNYEYIVIYPNSTYVAYNIQNSFTNIQVVDQFNAAFLQQNNMYEIYFYQITLTEPILEQPILSQSQILSYSAGGTNNTDNNYMVLMYLTEDQYLFINFYSATLSNNYYNYSLLNTTSISISQLMYNHTFAGSDAYEIQIIQIIMNNQYIFSMQTVITTKYFYSYLVNINIFIGSSDLYTTQLNCLIPPYGNWGKVNQINGNNQTLILIYREKLQTVTALYDLNQCQNQSTLNFSVGIPYTLNQSQSYFPIILLTMYPNADLYQSTLAIGYQQKSNFYNFSKNIFINIEESKNMKHNQSIFLYFSNNFMQYYVTVYLDVRIMAWWAWLLISLAIVLVVGATTFLIIRRKRQKKEKEKSLLEME